MVPTVGRSVHYFPVAGGRPLHAVITRVFSPTCVNLDVAVVNSEYPQTDAHPTSIYLRDDPSQAAVWDWLERVQSPISKPDAQDELGEFAAADEPAPMGTPVVQGEMPEDGDDENTPAGI